jgi:predicted ArsR family transcriptional regulator
MSKLTHAQRTILSTAAGRNGHLVLPIPKSLKLPKGASRRTLKELLDRNLIEERPPGSSQELWRKDNGGRRITLVLTDIALATLKTEPASGPSQAPAKPNSSDRLRGSGKKHSPSAPVGRLGKRDTILELLRRPKGAKIAELQKATGWQPHSVRAMLTGLRKRGIAIDRDTNAQSETVYKAARA